MPSSWHPLQPSLPRPAGTAELERRGEKLARGSGHIVAWAGHHCIRTCSAWPCITRGRSILNWLHRLCRDPSLWESRAASGSRDGPLHPTPQIPGTLPGLTVATHNSSRKTRTPARPCSPTTRSRSTRTSPVARTPRRRR